MDFGRLDDTLAGLRATQEEFVDRCGWDAAGIKWYWQAERRRHVFEIGADLRAVLFARLRAIVASGISRHILYREWQRAWPALSSYVMLLIRFNSVQPGRLRKVFRYTYCGWDKRRNPQPVAL